MMYIGINSIAIQNIRVGGYRCLITGITKTEALSLFRNADSNKVSNSINKEFDNKPIYNK